VLVGHTLLGSFPGQFQHCWALGHSLRKNYFQWVTWFAKHYYIPKKLSAGPAWVSKTSNIGGGGAQSTDSTIIPFGPKISRICWL